MNSSLKTLVIRMLLALATFGIASPAGAAAHSVAAGQVPSAAILASGQGAPLAAAASPEVEGRWNGVTAAGFRVSFDVEEGQVLNPHYGFRWGTYCGDFESTEMLTYEINPAGHWGNPTPQVPEIEGAFVAPDLVEGKVIAPGRELPSCPTTEVSFTAEPGEPTPPEEPEVRAVQNIVSRQLAASPHRMILDEYDALDLHGIEWQSFGGPVARATATAYENFCCPKDVKRGQVTLRLTHLVRVGPYRVYSKLTLVRAGRPPAGYKHRETLSML
jgi:hypothetical protein